MKPFFLSMSTLFLALSLTQEARAQTTLYSATGGLKVSQYGGWIVLPLSAETFSGGTTLFNTSASNAVQGGFSRTDQTLNRTLGFALGFTLKVDSEIHDGTNGPNRAGVSVIALSSDLMGIELGFWEDRVWAQSGPGFTKAEEGLFNTTSALTAYSLQFTGTTYALTANGTPLLSGPLRNYSSFGAPYNIPNFMFFGDNTTSARGSFRTSQISLSGAAPEPTSLGLLAVGLVGGALRRRRKT